MTQSIRQWPGDAGLPPGCRSADADPGADMLNELPAASLWDLLDDRAQANLYRRFFHGE
jgi:hypothetical protein